MSPRLRAATRVVILALAALALPRPSARADTISGPARDPGKVTAIGPGVKEIDLGGLFLLSYRADGAGSSSDIASVGGLGVQYFLRDNVSVGVTVLGSYESLGGGVSSSAGGAALTATHHVRLGLGAFLRPTGGVGMTFGTLSVESAPGSYASARAVTAFVRLAVPVAYFVSNRVLLSAGPELQAGSVWSSPAMGPTVRSSRTIGGFGIGVGYVF